MTTVFVTRYALSGGIRECEVLDKSSRDDSGVIWVKWPNQWNNRILLRKNDYWTTLEAAQAEADHLRNKKIASLNKQIAKLEKLTFSLKQPKENV